MTRVFRFASADALAQAAAQAATVSLSNALRERPRASLALSGGRSPTGAYRALARAKLDWSRVDFYFVDERCVPPTDAESNYLLANETLFAPLGAKPAQVFRMEGEREDRDAAARDYASKLPASLDVVILGLGEDGHTASLFPHAASLRERASRVLAIQGPKPPPWRLTLAPPALAAARHVLMIVTGAGKAAMVRASVEEDGPVEAVPGRLARNADWYLDEAAASALRGEKT